MTSREILFKDTITKLKYSVDLGYKNVPNLTLYLSGFQGNRIFSVACFVDLNKLYDNDTLIAYPYTKNISDALFAKRALKKLRHDLKFSNYLRRHISLFSRDTSLKTVIIEYIQKEDDFSDGVKQTIEIT